MTRGGNGTGARRPTRKMGKRLLQRSRWLRKMFLRRNEKFWPIKEIWLRRKLRHSYNDEWLVKEEVEEEPDTHRSDKDDEGMGFLRRLSMGK